MDAAEVYEREDRRRSAILLALAMIYKTWESCELSASPNIYKSGLGDIGDWGDASRVHVHTAGGREVKGWARTERRRGRCRTKETEEGEEGEEGKRED